MLSLIATPTELGVVIASQLSGCSPPLETHVFLRRMRLDQSESILIGGRGIIVGVLSNLATRQCACIILAGVCIARSRFLARHLSISKLWMNDLPQRQPLLSALSCKAEGVEPTHHDAFRVYDEP